MKDLKISKELIKNVLVEETKNLSDDFIFDIKDNYILFADEGECQFEVNIYKFAFKCKEWAISKGYQIISSLSDEPAYREQDEKAYAKLLWYEGDDIHREYKDMYFMAYTEIKAVIKASEYVLKELNENR